MCFNIKKMLLLITKNSIIKLTRMVVFTGLALIDPTLL